jgi:hypothetical protein|tara:strand:- start:1125 stop:1820 length:696 start_codon:yes stop_codon:yes gene_type:complete
MNHVVCVKWGNKYPSIYVNVLKNMVARHTSVTYQFTCLTDDPNGIDEDVNIIRFPNEPYIKSWWSKLWMFSPEMPLKGNILYFDLDVIIFDNIDPLFSNPGRFNIIRDFNRCRVKDWKLSNSSCMRWQSGTMNYLWTEFKENPARVMQQNHGDQDWITKKAKDEITWFPDEWIRSYKWEMIGLKDTKLLNKDGKKWFRKPVDINPGNRVAVFHGSPNPMECADEWVINNWK